MPAFLRAALSLTLIVSIALSTASVATAQEAKGKKKITDGTNDRAFAISKDITLTSEQQTKLDDLKKEQAPKIVELTTKLDAGLTDEQKTARKEATAKAKADGKKGKEAASVIEESLKLTDDQKKQREEVQTDLTKLQRSIKEQIYGFLTDEQKTHFKLPKMKKDA